MRLGFLQVWGKWQKGHHGRSGMQCALISLPKDPERPCNEQTGDDAQELASKRPGDREGPSPSDALDRVGSCAVKG